MVPVGGLEPPRISAGDFESPMSTNSITPALHLARRIITTLWLLASDLSIYGS